MNKAAAGEFPEELLARVRELDQDIKAWPYVWVGNTYLPARRGHKCRVPQRSKHEFKICVEFADGERVIAHPAYIRKRPTR